MPDRLAEIRERLTEKPVAGDPWGVIAQQEGDIAWLLDEVERLRGAVMNLAVMPRPEGMR